MGDAARGAAGRGFTEMVKVEVLMQPALFALTVIVAVLTVVVALAVKELMVDELPEAGNPIAGLELVHE